MKFSEINEANMAEFTISVDRKDNKEILQMGIHGKTNNVISVSGLPLGDTSYSNLFDICKEFIAKIKKEQE
jgi:hypothetical protein